MGGLEFTRRTSSGLRSVHWPADGNESERVLGHLIVASDDDQLRHVVNTALRQLGCTGTFVRSGVDVMNCAYRRRPRLVLLDQYLRDLTGLEVARALSANQQTRFVLIGSSFTTSVTVAAMKLGAYTGSRKAGCCDGDGGVAPPNRRRIGHDRRRHEPYAGYTQRAAICRRPMGDKGAARVRGGQRSQDVTRMGSRRRPEL